MILKVGDLITSNQNTGKILKIGDDNIVCLIEWDFFANKKVTDYKSWVFYDNIKLNITEQRNLQLNKIL